MRTFLYVASFMVFAVGCSDAEHNSQEVDERDFLPKSSKDYDAVEEKESNETSETTELTLADSLLQELQQILPFATSKDESSNLFPNRFDYLFKDVLSNRDEENHSTLHYWQFSDRNQTLSVFFNWLDCFGSSCETLRVGEKEQQIPSIGFALWISDTWIIYLETNHPFNVKVYTDKFLTVFKQVEWLHHCYQQPGRKITWENI